MLSARRCWSKARIGTLQAAAYHASHPASQSAGLNAFVDGTNDPSRASPQGTGNGALEGKQIAVKDNIATISHPTTAASKILANYTSPFDATVVKLLRQNGATISSKTNLDEFGMGSHSQHSHAGALLSPYTRAGVPLSPGGSSGGSAVAVAKEQCWAALGTDTGGSVRLPAAYTGVVGFKPSYGLLSRWGVIQYANSLDTVGVLANSVTDARQIFHALNIHDTEDPTSLPPSLRARIKASSNRYPSPSGKLRIGIPLTYNLHELSPAIRSTYTATLTHLQNSGHTLHPISLPTTRHALPAYYILAPAEASSNLAKYDGVRYGHRPSVGPDSAPAENLQLYARTRGEAFGPEVRRRILLGAYTLSSAAMDNYFIQAQRVRRMVQRDFDAVFARGNPLLDPTGEVGPGGAEEGKVDVILTPTAPTLPPTVEEVRGQSPVESYMNDIFTVPASLAGLPTASVPVKLSEHVREANGIGAGDVDFAGMQVIGQFGDDEAVLRAAELVETAGL